MNNIKNNKLSKTRKNSTDSTDVKEVYELYLKCFKLPDDDNLSDEAKLKYAKNRYRLTDSRKEVIKRRLKDAGKNMLRAAIVGYSRQKNFEGRRHWAGDNDTGWTAGLTEFICRNYEQVEKGANFFESQRANKRTNDPWAQ